MRRFSAWSVTKMRKFDLTRPILDGNAGEGRQGRAAASHRARKERAATGLRAALGSKRSGHSEIELHPSSSLALRLNGFSIPPLVADPDFLSRACLTGRWRRLW